MFRLLDYRYAAVVFLTVLFSAFLLMLTSPSIPIEESVNLILDSADAAVCALLLFKVEELRRTRSKIFLNIFIPMSMLLVASSIDLVSQIKQIPEAFEFVEGILHNIGFILFIFACVSWVNDQKEQSAELRHLAESDALTGISNRRSFLELSQNYLRSEDDNESCVSLLLLDIDHFKQINDTYGHQIGDKVLVDVANTVKQILRKQDYFARVGGEEFMVLLKDTEESTAQKVAEKIRSAIEGIEVVHHGSRVSCTISVGTTASKRKQAKFDDLFNQADKALYSAKAKGRNCVVQYGA